MNCVKDILKNLKAYVWQKTGQAFIEFFFVSIVLILLAFGVMEFGNMISLSVRMASVCREVGRTFYANEYDTNTIDDIFMVATNMIAPGNLQSSGKMIVSIVERVSGDSSFLTSTNNANDVLVITNQFFYPYGADPTILKSNAPSWTSRLPTDYYTGSGASKKLVPYPSSIGPVSIGMLPLNGRTAIVEVFHSNSVVKPLNNFGVTVQPYLYDISAF